MTSVTNEQNADQWARVQGQPAYDNMGQKIGDVQRIFFGERTNEPLWATVRSGRFGTKEIFVPLAGSRIGPAGLAVAVGKDKIEKAPMIEVGTELSAGDSAQLNRYYEGVMSAPQKPGEPMPAEHMEAPAKPPEPTTPPEPAPAPMKPAEATKPPEPTAAAPTRTMQETQPAEMTTFEEQLRVGTEAVEAGSIRLHKYVVKEQVETSVPVRHEEVRIERMPAKGGPAVDHKFENEVAEVTLHEERPIVSKETTPVETVRMVKEVRTDQQPVTDEVRKERVEVEDKRSGHRRRR